MCAANASRSAREKSQQRARYWLEAPAPGLEPAIQRLTAARLLKTRPSDYRLLRCNSDNLNRPLRAHLYTRQRRTLDRRGDRAADQAVEPVVVRPARANLPFIDLACILKSHLDLQAHLSNYEGTMVGVQSPRCAAFSVAKKKPISRHNT